MNASHPTPARRLGRYAALGLAALGMTALASAQTSLLSETFSVDTAVNQSLNDSVWTFGRTVGASSATVSGGRLALNVASTTTSRVGIVTDATNYNPFQAPLRVDLQGISLTGAEAGLKSFYAVVGRLGTDLGGAISAVEGGNMYNAGANYTAGAANYGGGGTAFGISLNMATGYDTAATNDSVYRLQVLESGAALGQLQFSLTGMPTDISFTLNGAANSWSISLTGATFSSALVNTMGAGYNSATFITGASTISGSFVNYTDARMLVGSDYVSRLVIGANNGGTVTTGVYATLDGVTVSAIPEPSTYAAIFGAVIGAFVIYRRRRQA